MTAAPFSPGGLLRLLAFSFRSPTRAAEMLVELNMTRAVLWQALVLVTVIGVLIVAVAPGPMPEAGPVAGPEPVVLSPFAYAMILGASLVMLVFALHFTGAALGGTGSFQATLTLVVWLEVMATAVRFVQVVMLYVAPVLAGLVSIAGVVVLFWALVSFIKVLHGFQSVGRAVLTLFLAILGISFGIALILTLIGAGMPGGPFDV